MAKVRAGKVLFFWLVAGGFVATTVLFCTLFGSFHRSTDIRYGLSLSLYLKTSVDGDKDPYYRAKKLTELFTSDYPPKKPMGSGMENVTQPIVRLQRPAAEHQMEPADISNATPVHSISINTKWTRHVYSPNTTFSHRKAAQTWRKSKITSSSTSATSQSPPPNLTARERSYLLSMNITQQISGALHGYTDLATLGALLNLSTVEPYIVGTRLLGVPSIKEARNVIKLSKLYDFDMLRSTLKKCSSSNDHEMSTFENFVEQASPEVIFVYMLTSLNRIMYNSLFGSNQSIVEIGSTGKTTQKALERLNRWAFHISPLKLPGFYISRVFVIDAQPMKALHLSDVLDVLGSAIRWKVARHGSATVLFNNWEAIHNVPDSRHFYYIPEFVYRPCRSIYNVSHSQIVIDAARTFALNLGDDETKTRIGVHVRGERVLKVHRGSFNICLEKVKDLINTTYGYSATGYQVRLIHDLGKYGTRTCYQLGFCKMLQQSFLFKVRLLGLPSVHFYPYQYPTLSQSPAFVAAVEQEYLSRMDVLVTVGAGGFQTRTITMFMKHAENSRNHLYKICSDKFSDTKDLIKVF